MTKLSALLPNDLDIRDLLLNAANGGGTIILHLLLRLHQCRGRLGVFRRRPASVDVIAESLDYDDDGINELCLVRELVEILEELPEDDKGVDEEKR